MKTLSIFLFFCMLSGKLYSTNQVSDLLIWNSDTLWFYESPLGQLPTHKVQKIFEDGIEISSDCWRGFYAEWKIVDEVLYLMNVYECNSERNISSKFEEVIGRRFQNGLMRADWVNGNFWCGLNLVPEHTLYVSIYQHEYNLTMEAGIISQKKEYHYNSCKYNNDESWTEFILPRMKWSELPDISNRRVEISVYIAPNNKGDISIVTIEHSNDSRYNAEVEKAVKLLPCVTIYYNQGRIWDAGENINVVINKENLKKYIR